MSDYPFDFKILSFENSIFSVKITSTPESSQCGFVKENNTKLTRLDVFACVFINKNEKCLLYIVRPLEYSEEEELYSTNRLNPVSFVYVENLYKRNDILFCDKNVICNINHKMLEYLYELKRMFSLKKEY